MCGFQTLPTFNIEEKYWFATKTNCDRNATIDEGDGNGYPDARRCHGLVQSGSNIWIIAGKLVGLLPLIRLDADTFIKKKIIM